MTGVYGPGMHQFVLDEAELGYRVACRLDEEQAWAGMCWLLDIQYAEYVKEQLGRHAWIVEVEW